MPRLLIPFVFPLLFAVGVLKAADEQSAPAADSSVLQARAALQTLTTWQMENPSPTNRTLQVVYWTPSDREPAANYHQRLTGIMEHIQDFYRQEMKRHGFGELTFPLTKDEQGLLKIHLVRGQKPFADYDRKSGGRIRQECLPTLQKAGLNANHETLLIFCNLATWDATQNHFSHKSPYYAGGSHRGGNAWQLDSPELSISNLAAKQPLITDEQYGKVSLGKHNSLFIGGIAHELGHALSLPHNREAPALRKKNHRALMGDGNRRYGDQLRGEGPGAHLEFASALRLASHPLFSGSQKEIQVHAHTQFQDLSVTPREGSFLFSGKVTSNLPIYGLVAYLDPEGKGDYDAHTVTAVPDSDGRFAFDCRHLVAGKRAELRIFSCHANGATCQRSYSYAVNQEGQPEVSALQTHFALAPLIQALNARDHSRLQPAFDQLHTKLGPGPQLNEVNHLAKRLVAGATGKQFTEPKNIPPSRKRIPLSDLTPQEQKVGWGQPAYDHLPHPDLLLTSAGQLHPHGIYAHAPALHRYQLDKGWTKLTGTCGLAENRHGSCVFIIKIDGREAFRSPVIRNGQSHPFAIDIKGADRVELVTNDAGDCTGSDWALWLSPTLHR